MTALDAIHAGAHELAKRVYQATAREIRGLGIAVDEDTFDRAVLMFVERQHLPELEQQDELQRINDRGWFDCIASGTPMRIARDPNVD